MEKLLGVCKLLEKYQIHYLIIGGTAVALNGYFRISSNAAGKLADKLDINIWYNPTYTNYFNFLKVLEELGQDISKFRDEQIPNPRKSFFKFEFDDFTFDALPSIKADIKFFEAYQRKGTVDIEGTPIHYISYLDLIEDKKATARKKDMDDIEHLKKIRGED
ncbi:hypothetical protein [Persicitalea jodogahamensis]|nr:hypothetical protein [Persicitalea jodogahamensis]